jgi:hypothetical protein
MRLTVYFDGRFWVGILEEQEWGGPPLRHVFGAEPGDKEILLFVRELMPAISPPAALLEIPSRAQADGMPIAPRPPKNPKRLMREAAHATKRLGGSTKSKEALSLMREEFKKEARNRNKLKEEAEREHKREIAKLKARKKHQGH